MYLEYERLKAKSMNPYEYEYEILIWIEKKGHFCDAPVYDSYNKNKIQERQTKWESNDL